MAKRSAPAVRAAEKTYDPARLEARIRELWEVTDAQALVRGHRRGRERWYIIDGPPYATGHIHLGTARNKTLKDAMIRHMRMRGFDVRDQPGFDMHGLPIEVKVEQELGFSSKKDIEAFGIDRFVGKCREFAVRFKDIMTAEFVEMGVSMDWQRPYMTITNDYIEGAWWALAKAHERGLLYEGERVLTWCWRCETALAAAEVEHETRRDPSVYVKFPLAGRPGEHLVVWTTTPWTLPANVAIAAHPEIRYARVRATRDDATEVLVVAESLVEAVVRAGRYTAFEVLETMPGTELEGWWYEHPFEPEVPYHQEPLGGADKRYRVLLGEHVQADRTGLVHTATGHGVEDFELGRRYGIPPFCPVGEDGRYTRDAGAFEGLAVKGKGETSEADARVLDLLRERGLLLAAKSEEHAYGHCWRCKNPIIFRATRQWFLNIHRLKDRMLSEVDRVRWTPEWAGSSRQRDWVEQARDWCVSRQRYWGIPLPVWRCHAGHLRVVGTRRELEADGRNCAPDMDLHRPWIDDVVLACRECGETMRRVPDVLDVWFDSAVASWAELGFPKDDTGLDAWFPADFIVEGLDQTRGWFYSQLCAGVAAMDRVPYESVLMHGWVNDEQGRPMSKSLGNIIPPHDVIVRHGADALRFDLVRSGAPWDDLSFGWESARNTSRFFNILWNLHVFATTYMTLDGFDPSADETPPRRPEDRWLESRLATVTRSVTDAFEALELHRAAREVERFVLEDLSRWYVRLARDRVWDEEDAEAKRAAYTLLRRSLLVTAKLLAPFAPFTSEAVYQDLDGSRASVHLEDWPAAGEADAELEGRMATVRAIVEAVANARQKAGMKLRWPVARLVVSGSKEVEAALKSLEPILLEQANAKRIEFVGEAWVGLEWSAVPVKKAIGTTFRAQGGEVLKRLAAADARAVRTAIATEGRWDAGDGLVLLPEMVTFETKLPPHVAGGDFPGGAVYLDTDVTDELKGEGYARDLVRRIQESRKRLGLAVDARILSQVSASPEFAGLVRLHLADVASATRSDALDLVEKPTGSLVETWDIEGEIVVTAVSPADGATRAPAAPAPPVDAPPVARRTPARRAASKPAKRAGTPKKAASAPAKRAAKKAPKGAARSTAKAAKKAPRRAAPARKPATKARAAKTKKGRKRRT